MLHTIGKVHLNSYHWLGYTNKEKNYYSKYGAVEPAVCKHSPPPNKYHKYFFATRLSLVTNLVTTNSFT